MTKESILGELPIEVQGDYFRDDVLKAMDEYAKQKTMEFHSFIHGDISRVCFRNNEGGWEVIKPSKTPQPNEILTDDQMWNQFLQHQSQQP